MYDLMYWLNPGRLLFLLYRLALDFVNFLNTPIDLGVVQFTPMGFLLFGSISTLLAVIVLIIVKRVVPLA